MKTAQKIYLTIWSIFSIACSLFLSCVIFLFLGLSTIDLHKNTSGPGDFAPAPASVILNDILINWAIGAGFVVTVAGVGYVITRSLINDLAPPSHRVATKFLYGLFIFNVLLLCAGVIYMGIFYWFQRAPYFTP